MLLWLSPNSAVLGGSAPFDQYINTLWESLKHTWEQMTWERERDEGGGRRDDERGWELPGARCSLCLFDVCLSWGKWRMAQKFSSTQFSSVQLYLCNSTLLQSCPRALYSVGSSSSNSRSQLGGDLPFEKAATSSGSWLSDWRNEIETSTKFLCVWVIASFSQDKLWRQVPEKIRDSGIKTKGVGGGLNQQPHAEERESLF